MKKQESIPQKHRATRPQFVPMLPIHLGMLEPLYAPTSSPVPVPTAAAHSPQQCQTNLAESQPATRLSSSYLQPTFWGERETGPSQTEQWKSPQCSQMFSFAKPASWNLHIPSPLGSTDCCNQFRGSCDLIRFPQSLSSCFSAILLFFTNSYADAKYRIEATKTVNGAKFSQFGGDSLPDRLQLQEQPQRRFSGYAKLHNLKTRWGRKQKVKNRLKIFWSRKRVQ